MEENISHYFHFIASLMSQTVLRLFRTATISKWTPIFLPKSNHLIITVYICFTCQLYCVNGFLICFCCIFETVEISAKTFCKLHIVSWARSKSNTWGIFYMCTHTCGAGCLSLFFGDLWALLCCCCWRRICRATCKAWVRKKTDKNNVRKQKFMNNSFSSVMFRCWGLTLPWERLYCFLASKMWSKWCHVTAGLDTVFPPCLF